MNLDRHPQSLFRAALIFSCVLVVPLAFLDPESSTYIQAAAWSLRLASITKLFFVGLLVMLSSRITNRLSREDALRRPWMIWSAAFLLYFVAQSVLSYYQVLRSVSTPFPSLADAFFVPAMLFLILGAFALLEALARSGMPIDHKMDVGVVGGSTFLVIGLLGYFLLRPILAGGSEGLELLLSLFYPVSDFFLLVPSVILLRIAWKMRGGVIGRIWGSLFLGVAALSVGDIAFAYLSAASGRWLEVLADLMFLWAYILLA